MWAGIWRRSSGGLVVARSSAERFVTAGNFAPFGLIQYSGTRVAVSRCRNLGSDTHTFRSLIVCNTDRRDCLFHHMIISQRFLLTKRISTLMILGALSRRVPCSYAGRWVSMPNAPCRSACSPRFALRAWHPAHTVNCKISYPNDAKKRRRCIDCGIRISCAEKCREEAKRLPGVTGCTVDDVGGVQQIK